MSLGHCSIGALVLIFFFNFSLELMASEREMAVYRGGTPIRGEITEGGCIVSSDNRDMHVDMGDYTNKDFRQVGSVAPYSIHFNINLMGCKSELVNLATVNLYGLAAPKNSHAFFVKSGNKGIFRTATYRVDSGLGLMITDDAGNIIIPNKVYPISYRFQDWSLVLHYTAHYLATSGQVHLRGLSSEVWFNITYL